MLLVRLDWITCLYYTPGSEEQGIDFILDKKTARRGPDGRR